MPRFLTIFIFGWWWGGQLKSQSAKISDNFHWGGGILQLKSQSAKISGGGGYSATEKSQSAKISDNLNLGGVF